MTALGSLAKGDEPAQADHLEALERAGVAWAVLRGGEGAGRQGRDLDVLVDPAALDVAARALEADGFVQLPQVEPHARSFVRRDQAAAAGWSFVDLTTRFAFGRVPKLRLPVEQGVLERSERGGGTRRVAPADGSWLLLLHAVLDHPAFDDRHRAQLAALSASSDPDAPVARMLDAVIGRPVAERLHGHVVRGEWDALERLVRAIHAAAGGRSGPVERAGARLRRIGRRLPGMVARPGLGVAIIGPDGAGKSSLVHELSGSLPVPTRTRYLGLFGASHRPARIRGLGFLRRLARVWTGVLADSAAMARGRIVVYDRYPYDMLRSRGAESAGRRIRRWIEAHAAPPPDLVILLNAPAEVLHRRRPEHSVEELRGMLEHYRSIAADLDNVAVIDASVPRDDVLRAATDAIWRRYAARLRR